MIVITKQGILQQIVDDWGDAPQVSICTSIFNYLTGPAYGRPIHLTYSNLRRIVGQDCDNTNLLLAIQYLCGERANLLKAGFELIDDDGSIDISSSDINTARESGILIHPENGRPVPNYEEKVFIYFKPSSLLNNIT